jgi:hypothetical protein
LIPRKNPVPSVREIEQSHVQHEHPVVTPQGTPKDLRQRPFETGFELFGFHF